LKSFIFVDANEEFSERPLRESRRLSSGSWVRRVLIILFTDY